MSILKMFGIFLLVVVYNKILPVIWECVHCFSKPNQVELWKNIPSEIISAHFLCKLPWGHTSQNWTHNSRKFEAILGKTGGPWHCLTWCSLKTEAFLQIRIQFENDSFKIRHNVTENELARLLYPSKMSC